MLTAIVIAIVIAVSIGTIVSVPGVFFDPISSRRRARRESEAEESHKTPPKG
jgi:hypothetical protein